MMFRMKWLITAKFGKDLFNISKVVGRRTKWPRFLNYPVFERYFLQLSDFIVTLTSLIALINKKSWRI